MPIFRRKKHRTFTLDVYPVMGNVSPGGSASASVVARPSNKEVATVNLAAGYPQEGGEFPAGVHVSFNPPLGVMPFTSVMNISTSPEVAPGAYPFLVTGTSGDAKQVKTYTLIVRPAKPVAKPATKPAVRHPE